MAHPMACAAGLAVQRAIAEEQLLGRVKTRGARLHAMLEDRFGEHPHVGEVRGRGLFQGIELIADRASKQPFAPEHRLHARIKAEAMARGLLCYPAGGTIDGRRGDHVLLAPPFIVTDDDLDRIVDRLGQAVEAAIEQVSRAAA
jgi:adenosylmethionine-8-amino-7-oxononanoate aminotransferase